MGIMRRVDVGIFLCIPNFGHSEMQTAFKRIALNFNLFVVGLA